MNAPFRGYCGYCKKPVKHFHPWWDSNPDTHPDAKVFHTDCYFKQDEDVSRETYSAKDLNAACRIFPASLGGGIE